MTVPGEGRDRDVDCLVIGGGLAGLAAAHELVRSGRTAHVLEAEESVGGRARTVWHRGRPVDCGFQAVLAGYRETATFLRAIGLRRRDLRPVAGGVAINGGGGWTRLRPGPLGVARFDALPARDRLRLARLGAEVRARAPEAFLEGPEERESTEAYLRARGFGAEAMEGFFRPFFGVVLLDRGLAADAGYFRFLLSSLAHGGAAMPSDGHGMIAEWAAAAVRRAGARVETGARVLALEPDAERRRVAGVRMEDGRRLSARYVVLAVDAPAARAFLEPLDRAAAARVPLAGASQSTAAFALSRPLYRGPLVLVNAALPPRRGPHIDLVCQTTNVTRPGAPEGPHILLATSVTTEATSDGRGPADAIEDAVAALVRDWAPGFPWLRVAEPIDVFHHAFAQFRPLPGVRRDLPGPRTALDNLILAGDLTAHPSIEGAIKSGVRAAGIVDALIP